MHWQDRPPVPLKQFVKSSLTKMAVMNYEFASPKLPDWHNIRKADCGPGGAADAREAHMVDVVRVKPPEQVRGRLLPQRQPGRRIRAFQPEEELPLQTRCRCS